MNHLIDNLPEIPIHGLTSPFDARPLLKKATLPTEIKSKIISQSTSTVIAAALTQDHTLINDLAATNTNISALVPPIDKTILNTCLIHCREIPTITYLLTHGADINTTDNNGRTLLIIACSIQEMRLAAHLLTIPSTNIDHQDHVGETALFHAISHHHLPIMQLLLDNNANQNIKNKGGISPLHKASAKANCTEMVKLLISAGANQTAIDNCGNLFTKNLTPSESAEINKHLTTKSKNETTAIHTQLTQLQQEIAALRTNLTASEQQNKLLQDTNAILTAKLNTLKAMII